MCSHCFCLGAVDLKVHLFGVHFCEHRTGVGGEVRVVAGVVPHEVLRDPVGYDVWCDVNA